MRKLKVEDIQIVKKYSKLADYKEYNSNIVTMLMWDHMFEIFIEEHEYYLLILVNYKNNYGWLMPLCEEKYLPEAFFAMREYSIKHEIHFEIHGIIDKVKTVLDEQEFKLVYQNNRNAYDYIYDVKMHASLSGKKMQKRRNHYNAFMKEYQNRYSYHALKKDDLPHVYAFLDEWKQSHKDIEAIENEIAGIHHICTYFDELELQGGCIYIDGKLEAFSIYSYLADDMIQIHVEKANRDIRGLYVALLKHVCMALPSHILYMNREDDLGLEELRKAKLDLQPIQLVKKYNAYEGSPDIVQADSSYLPQIKQLWNESFQDETAMTADFFFQNLFHFEDCWLLVDKDTVISMAQIRKLPIMKDKKVIQAPFIFGVATKASYQNLGYMRMLLNHVLNVCTPFCLIQAYNWDLYRSFGFKDAYKLKKTAYQSSKDGCAQLCKDSQHLLDLYEKYIADKEGYRIRDLAYYDNYLIPYTYLDGYILANEQAYIQVYEMNDEVLVKECIYTDIDALKQCLNTLSHSKIWVITDLDCPVDGESFLIHEMMARGDYELSDNMFINEIM